MPDFIGDYWLPLAVAVTAGVLAWGARHLLNAKARILRPDEKAILRASVRSGMIQELKTDQTGAFIRAGGTDFVDLRDPAVAAKAWTALSSLVEKGLVTQDEGRAWSLTGPGFEKARELAGPGAT